MTLMQWKHPSTVCALFTVTLLCLQHCSTAGEAVLNVGLEFGNYIRSTSNLPFTMQFAVLVSAFVSRQAQLTRVIHAYSRLHL